MDFSTAWIVLLFFVLFFLKTKDAAAAALFGVLNFVNCLFAMQISRIVMGEMLKVRDPAAEQLFLFAFIGVVAYLAGRLFRGGGSGTALGRSICSLCASAYGSRSAICA
ncbi:hypothetical protein CM49_01183 [Paenibacillus sp. P1XP2]|nr:hypothetical protein CM49_01183 [Paenibacillus sp. P1XP2]